MGSQVAPSALSSCSFSRLQILQKLLLDSARAGEDQMVAHGAQGHQQV